MFVDHLWKEAARRVLDRGCSSYHNTTTFVNPDMKELHFQFSSSVDGKVCDAGLVVGSCIG